MFKINWTNIKSAIIYGFVASLLGGVITLIESIVSHGSIFGLDWKHVIDVSAMAALAGFVSITSVVKNLLTSDNGKFLGAVTVIPDKKFESK